MKLVFMGDSCLGENSRMWREVTRGRAEEGKSINTDGTEVGAQRVQRKRKEERERKKGKSGPAQKAGPTTSAARARVKRIW
jgi:hypothetical protein